MNTIVKIRRAGSAKHASRRYQWDIWQN